MNQPNSFFASTKNQIGSFSNGGACNIMVVIIGNRYKDPSSNPGGGCLNFLLCKHS